MTVNPSIDPARMLEEQLAQEAAAIGEIERALAG